MKVTIISPRKAKERKSAYNNLSSRVKARPELMQSEEFCARLDQARSRAQAVQSWL